MKKTILIFLAFIMTLIPSFVGCGKKSSGTAGKTEVLKIYNCEDYIAEADDELGTFDVLEGFSEYMKEKGRNVRVEYSTFGTLENMYNELIINPGYYDLVCPSEYMIQKMMHENMLQPFSDDFKNSTGEFENNNYYTYASPFIQNIFHSTTEVNGEQKSWGDYAACYMWGTLGIVYNPEKVDDADMESWANLWNSKYKNMATVKDSIRDTYFLGLAKTYKEELDGYAKEFANGTITATEYTEKLNVLFNRTDKEAVDAVGRELINLRGNIYGFEVDSGKNDMITGKISINFAWSGDAVYAMDEAEVSDVFLNYSVPKEGSNIWFDGWCMPKGGNRELAEQFINYVSTPEVAIDNMEFIGYTSAIAGQEIADWLTEYYELTDVQTEENPYKADLSYFFDGTLDGGSGVFYSPEIGRQFNAQYPTTDITARLTVMNFFDKEANERLNDMWEKVKGASMPVWLIILSVIAIIALIVCILLYRFKDKLFKKNYSTEEKPLKNGLKIISKEEIVYYKSKGKV